MDTMTARFEHIRYTTDELEEMPTLTQGQADDLKIDDGDGIRIWLGRCGVADGEPFDNPVTIEVLDERGRWYNAVRYAGDDPDVRLVGTPDEPVI